MPARPPDAFTLTRLASWRAAEAGSNPLPNRSVKVLTLTPGGELLSGCADGRVMWWQQPANKPAGGKLEALCEYIGHTSEVSAICFVPELRRLFTASHDSTVKIWMAPTGADGSSDSVPRRPCVATLRWAALTAAAPVSCLLTHAGWLVSGSHDRSLCWWP